MENRVMTLNLAAVGLNIVHTRLLPAIPINLDASLSRPLVTSDDYLYGLFGDSATRSFLYELANREQGCGRPSYELSKLYLSVQDGNAAFDPAVGLSGLEYLRRRPAAGFRRAFQSLFCAVVERKHGDSEALRRLRTKDTESGFYDAVLAFPDCIADALNETDIVVAVLPMRVSFNLVAPVSVVAKQAVARLLRSLGTGTWTNREYQITHADGRREELIPPPLTRPVITYSGRAGTSWRRGAHHPHGSGSAVS
jgi:hypothetical protein